MNWEKVADSLKASRELMNNKSGKSPNDKQLFRLVGGVCFVLEAAIREGIEK